MATKKQVAANRRNARNSTGPRTYTGKARAAQNSFKHGLLAKPALLPDESEKEFKEFAEELIDELHPSGPLECDCAERIVNQSWRLKRYARVEAALFISDRVARDVDYFRSLMGQYQTRRHDRELRELAGMDGGDIEITDEARHAEARENFLAALEAERGEVALLGSAFSSAAVSGDPFSKLGRYETTALNRLRNLISDFYELQSGRVASQPDDVVEELSSSDKDAVARVRP